MFQAEVNLTHTVTLDSACYYDRLTKAEGCLSAESLHICELTVELRKESVTSDELDGVILLGEEAEDEDDFAVYACARIMGKHFRAGEWGTTSQFGGSVVTCVIDGRSLYARVLRFMKSDVSGVGYASVRWFSEPTYDNVLCPRVNLNGDDVGRDVGGNFIKITQIDPSQVAVEDVLETGEYMMIRDSGYDTVRV